MIIPQKPMKKINKDPFSNGTEYEMFEYQCCDKCIKSSKMRENGTFTNADNNNLPNKCAVQRDIMLRMVSNIPVNERTIQICHDFIMKGKLCPYMQTERKKYTKKIKNQLHLEL